MKTDHKPLQYFSSQPNLSEWQLWWSEQLVDFLPGLTLMYTPGKDNVIPDAMPCRPDYLTNVPAMPLHGFVTTNLICKLHVAQQCDAHLGRYWRFACGQHTDYQMQQLESGQELLFFKNKLLMPKSMVGKIFFEYYDARGHFGQQRMQEMVSTHFYWPHMTHNIREYCRKCNVCARNKAYSRKVQELYQLLPVPEKPWEQNHFDFVTELPKHDRHSTITTVVDQFSKMVILVPLHGTGASEVACTFFNRVVCVYGVPYNITFDRDPRFTGKFQRSLMEQMRPTLQFSTAQHPQTDGMAKVTNHTMEQPL